MTDIFTKTPCAHVAAIRDSLPDHFQWDEREAALLDLAMRQAKDLEALGADIATHGVRSQSGRLSTIVSEARQSRVALSRILGQVDVPDSVRPAVSHARRAAQARWSG